MDDEYMRREINYAIVFAPGTHKGAHTAIVSPGPDNKAQTRKKTIMPCVKNNEIIFYALYEVRRYFPSGTCSSNRAPAPGSPVSRMDIPVIARISRAKKSP
jgi:hypothetical protein